MGKSASRFLILAVAAVLIATGGLTAWALMRSGAEAHPDLARYEYLYRDGMFVPPHKRFPEGRERGEWSCYDRQTKKTFDCSFVRGGFDRFQYIFRPSR